MRRALIASVSALVLVVVASVPALAITTENWEQRRIATEAFDAAASSATQSRTEALEAALLLSAHVNAARTAVNSAAGLAQSATGYFDPALVEAVAPLARALEDAMPAGVAVVPATPDLARPQPAEELAAAAGSLAEWAADLAERAEKDAAAAAALAGPTTAVNDAIRAVVATVDKQAQTALDAAPLASADSRAAVERARDALLESLEKPDITAYTSAVASLRASQAEAEAAAAAAAEASSGNTSKPRLPLPFVLIDPSSPDWEPCDREIYGVNCTGLG